MLEMLCAKSSLMPFVKTGKLSLIEAMEGALEIVKHVTGDQTEDSMPDVAIKHDFLEAMLTVSFEWDDDTALHIKVRGNGNHTISVLSAHGGRGLAGEEWGIMRTMIRAQEARTVRAMPRRKENSNVG